MIYDSHCHIDLMPNMIEIIQTMRKSQIGLFAVGTTPKAYVHELELCKSVPSIHVGLGMHPQLLSTGYDDMLLFEKLIPSSHYIGEIGLDFSKNYIHLKEKQIEAFERIIQMCEYYGEKVVSIHSLKSASSVIEIIQKNKVSNKNRYLLHWYTGTMSQLRKAVELGCFFSVNPKMLKTKSGVEIIKNIPADRILLETDAPFVKQYLSVQLIEKELKEMLGNISHILGKDISKIVEENGESVFIYN